MKKLLILLCISLMFISCKKEDIKPKECPVIESCYVTDNATRFVGNWELHRKELITNTDVTSVNFSVESIEITTLNTWIVKDSFNNTHNHLVYFYCNDFEIVGQTFKNYTLNYINESIMIIEETTSNVNYNYRYTYIQYLIYTIDV